MNNVKLAKELLVIARELLAVKSFDLRQQQNSGLNDAQVADLSRALRDWFARAGTKLTSQSGPIIVPVKLGTPKYDGKWIFQYSLNDMPDPDKLDTSKIEIETQPSGREDSSGLGSEHLDVQDMVVKSTDADVRSMTSNNFSAIKHLVTDIRETISARYSLRAIIKTEWGDFDTTVLAEMGYPVFSNDAKTMTISLRSPYVEGYAVRVWDEIRDNQEVMAKAMEILKNEILDNTRKKLESVAVRDKARLLENAMPRTSATLKRYDSSLMSAYEFIKSGKGGRFEVGSMRELTVDEPHRAKGFDYPVILVAKPASSQEFGDLFDDRRFSVELGRRLPFDEEV